MAAETGRRDSVFCLLTSVFFCNAFLAVVLNGSDCSVSIGTHRKGSATRACRARLPDRTVT